MRAVIMTDLSLSRSQMLLLSGSGNRALAEEVAAHLGQPLCQVTLRRFADGELFVKIDENVRGRDVYIIQPTNPPAENMMELLLLMDAAKRASAARVTSGMLRMKYASGRMANVPTRTKRPAAIGRACAPIRRRAG